MPELVVTPINFDDVVTLFESGADAILVGETKFSLRVPNNFNKDEILECLNIARKYDKKIYVALNLIAHNHLIDDITEYLKYLDNIKVDAVVYSDIGVYQIHKELNLDVALHYAPEMIIANYHTSNYWFKNGVKRVGIAKELTLDEIIETSDNSLGEIEIKVQGLIPMFQSIRDIVKNYLDYMKKDPINGNLTIYDEERNLQYPLYYDIHGTHIFSGNEMCVVDELDEILSSKVSSLFIDGILQDSNYVIQMTKLYKEAIDLFYNDRSEYIKQRKQFLLRAKNISKRSMDKGFLFKPTVYKLK